MPNSFLDVRSRNERVRVDLRYRRVFGPCVTDDLKGLSPSQYPQVIGEAGVVDEGRDMCLEVLDVNVGEYLDRSAVDGAIHPLGLAERPRVIGSAGAHDEEGPRI
jgi:hypothetical protein